MEFNLKINMASYCLNNDSLLVELENSEGERFQGYLEKVKEDKTQLQEVQNR